ncbi:MAG: hypothetical protein V1820_05085 [archaeon]
MRVRQEVGRKLVHAVYGLSLAYVVFSLEKPVSIALLTALFIFGGILLENRRKLPLTNFLLRTLGRKGEATGKGPLSFTMGALIAVALFPRNSAVWGIIFLAIGDAMATFAGVYLRKTHRIGAVKNKTWEGFFACFLSNFAVAAFFSGLPLARVFAAAIFTAFVEVAVPREIDDNLLIPSFAAVFF